MLMRAQRSGRPSWPWILASAAGFAIGGAIAGGVVFAAELALVDTAQSQADAAAALALVTTVSLGLTGATVGVLQWLVLRSWLPASGWWIAATAGRLTATASSTSRAHRSGPPLASGLAIRGGEAAFLVGPSLPSILSNPKVDRRAHARRTVWAIPVRVVRRIQMYLPSRRPT
jgi:hypothetical protein